LKEHDVSNEQQHDDSAAPATLSPAGASRRRFARAGAAASGVLLTLHSQPGMATAVCTTPSGFLSGALRSAHTNDQVTCVGVTSGYWKTHYPWTGSGCTSSTKFSAIFPCTRAMNTTYGGISCMGILTPQSWDKNGLGRQLMSAYLNVKTGKSSFQTVPMLLAIWNEWVKHGYYTPTSGVKWDSAAIANYLSLTMPI
jgi:hypothetical protein